jgi:hypothetical protein
VQAKTHGSNLGMKKYEFGFTFINFRRLLSPRDQLVVFPSHIQQVSFSYFIQELKWKVILHKTTQFRQVVGEQVINALPTNLVKGIGHANWVGVNDVDVNLLGQIATSSDQQAGTSFLDFDYQNIY